MNRVAKTRFAEILVRAGVGKVKALRVVGYPYCRRIHVSPLVDVTVYQEGGKRHYVEGGSLLEEGKFFTGLTRVEMPDTGSDFVTLIDFEFSDGSHQKRAPETVSSGAVPQFAQRSSIMPAPPGWPLPDFAQSSLEEEGVV